MADLALMREEYETIVCGLGATGSAALLRLAWAGRSVCGIDRFNPPHSKGSSHGESRIIRQAYHEDPFYVPFVQRAWTLWEDLQRETTEKIIERTGGIMLGSPRSGVVQGTLESANRHGLPVTYYDNPALQAAFPAFKTGSDTVGVLERNAGILFPEACIKIQLSQATRAGAEICRDETVLEIERGSSALTVRTDRHVFRAQSVVMAAGAWMPDLLPELKLPLAIERQVLYWFRDENNNDSAWRDLPVYIWEYEPGLLFYGFPDLGGGIKVARHHQGTPAHPDQYDTTVHQHEIDAMAAVLQQHLDMNPVFVRAETCLYSNTPDEHFIIDRHPQDDRIIIASPCSGHGFKFSSYVGEILARMASGEDPGIDLDFFRLKRFDPAPPFPDVK